MKEFTAKHIGKRMLIRKSYSFNEDVDEVTFWELSPSGIYMRIEWISGRCTWEECKYYNIVEILKPSTEIEDSS